MLKLSYRFPIRKSVRPFKTCCPFTVSYIYAILQQIYVQFRLDLEINVLLLKTLSFDTLQELLFLMFFLSFEF